jgi:ectoine hydroxylase-related dioxygenase (phytanoyl-CoA dioxygenase family)
MTPDSSRNIDFAWRDPEGPFQLLSSAQVRDFGRLGGFVLEDAFTAAEVAAVIEAIDPLEAESESLLRGLEGGRFGIARAGEIVFSPHLVARSEVLKQFSRHRVIRQLLGDLLGADVRLYWDQLVYKKPHTADEFPWHQDNGYTFVEPQQYLTCWIALTDATMDNGCPWILPGVHRLGTLEHRWTDLGFECVGDSEDTADALALPVEAGSIAVFSSLTPHRTGPNLTDATRKAYILQYAPTGAVMYPRGKPPVDADNADWQYQILSGGRAVDQETW